MFRRKPKILPASVHTDTRVHQVEIPADAVRIGMRVIRLDRPWDEVPLLFQQFVVQDTEQLDILRKYCLGVTVEFTEEQYRLHQRHGHQPQSDSRGTRAEKRSVAEELPNARFYYDRALAFINQVLSDVARGRELNLEEAGELVRHCVSSIMANPNAMFWLTRIRHEDAYTAEHCLRVGILAMTFGRFMDMPEPDLQTLGLCGILHDVGKMRIPGKLLNKPEALTREEWQIMRRHPEVGYRLLGAHHKLDPVVRDAALSHHERMDGGGYPNGLAGSAINRFTRMISIVDAYDAITSDRAYKQGLSNGDALRILYENSGKHYDGELVEAFIRMVGVYPPGSVVQLNSGEVAVVLSTRPDRKLFPTVELVLDARGHPCPSKVLRLADRPLNPLGQPYSITRALPDGAAGFDLEDHIRRHSQSTAPRRPAAVQARLDNRPALRPVSQPAHR